MTLAHGSQLTRDEPLSGEDGSAQVLDETVPALQGHLQRCLDLKRRFSVASSNSLPATCVVQVNADETAGPAEADLWAGHTCPAPTFDSAACNPGQWPGDCPISPSPPGGEGL